MRNIFCCLKRKKEEIHEKEKNAGISALSYNDTDNTPCTYNSVCSGDDGTTISYLKYCVKAYHVYGHEPEAEGKERKAKKRI